MAVMAANCPGVDIHVVDLDQRRIDSWNNLNGSELPVYEPGLQAVVDRVRGQNLYFSTDVAEAIREHSYQD
jgi:UDPglucose 6-dehydrogenase